MEIAATFADGPLPFVLVQLDGSSPVSATIKAVKIFANIRLPNSKCQAVLSEVMQENKKRNQPRLKCLKTGK
jgi:hypothetical protein